MIAASLAAAARCVFACKGVSGQGENIWKREGINLKFINLLKLLLSPLLSVQENGARVKLFG